MSQPTIQQTPTLRLEDRHFNYVEDLREKGYLTDLQRYKLWQVEQELNRRDLAARNRQN